MVALINSRFLSIISLLITFFSLSLPAYAQYSGGTGEPNDPYQIATAADLIALGETPDDYDKHFILTADIDLDPNLPGGKVFDRAVIAPDTDPNDKWGEFQGISFSGAFDGNGHTVCHLTIVGGGYLGLFGQLYADSWRGLDGQVKNLGVVDVSIAGAGGYVGGLIGRNTYGGRVMQCFSTGAVTGSEYVGGLVGDNHGDIIKSYSRSSVSGDSCVGGLVGGLTAYWQIATSYSSGSVVGTRRVGGLVGEISRSWNANPPMGIKGVAECYSTSTVHGDEEVGGLVGSNGGPITASYSSGSVSGNSHIGGLVGTNSYFYDIQRGDAVKGTISTCYSRGIVDGNEFVGGLVGSNWYGTIAKCYSTGPVIGTGLNVGGLVGTCDLDTAETTDCFWDTQTSGQSESAGGTGLTTAEMQTAKTFHGWGTCGNEGVWTIDEGNDYPRLAWENWPGEAIWSAMLSDLLLGSGTQDDPFLIFTPEELNVIGLYPCEWDKHFKVMADIDLSGFDGKDGRPAFNQIAPGRLYGGWFTGVLDGNGHEIQHLTLTIMDGGSGGLMGGLSGGGEVRDLGVVDVNITGSGAYVGGLVGYVRLDWPEGKGAVTHCYTTGMVQGNYLVGGIAGINGGDIAQCYSNTTVRGSGRHVGGLVGLNGGVVAQCCSSGIVSGAHYVGGLVGSNGIGEVIDCYSTCAVTGTGEYGGVGGLAGKNNDGNSIIRCYSTGTVAGNKDIGGLVGYRERGGTEYSSFWDIESSGQSISTGGTGKTTAEMQMAKTFLDAGWDFVGETVNGTEDIWWILENKGYPRLWWELDD